MTGLLVDTHVLQWLSAEPARLSESAAAAIDEADELLVAGITWFELAWLARRERILVPMPIRSWLCELAAGVRTLGLTPAVADTASGLPASFPQDPADRIIYATALEAGARLVTKDERMLAHPASIAVW